MEKKTEKMFRIAGYGIIIYFGIKVIIGACALIFIAVAGG